MYRTLSSSDATLKKKNHTLLQITFSSKRSKILSWNIFNQVIIMMFVKDKHSIIVTTNDKLICVFCLNRPAFFTRNIPARNSVYTAYLVHNPRSTLLKKGSTYLVIVCSRFDSHRNHFISKLITQNTEMITSSKTQLHLTVHVVYKTVWVLTDLFFIIRIQRLIKKGKRNMDCCDVDGNFRECTSLSLKIVENEVDHIILYMNEAIDKHKANIAKLKNQNHSFNLKSKSPLMLRRFLFKTHVLWGL